MSFPMDGFCSCMSELWCALCGCMCLGSMSVWSYWNTECLNVNVSILLPLRMTQFHIHMYIYIHCTYICMYIFPWIVLAWFLPNSPVSHYPRNKATFWFRTEKPIFGSFWGLWNQFIPCISWIVQIRNPSSFFGGWWGNLNYLRPGTPYYDIQKNPPTKLIWFT